LEVHLRLHQLLQEFTHKKVFFQNSAILILSDGTEFIGDSIGFSGITCGEVVFNTSMSGYQEIISDPSYSNQLVALTSPHIGNVGCNKDDMESIKPQLSGLIVKNLSTFYSNYRGEEGLNDFLIRNKVVGISNIDTRKLTLHLRKNGALDGVIHSFKESEDLNLIEIRKKALNALNSFNGILGMKLANSVSTSKSYHFNNDNFSNKELPLVVVYDFGVKSNILAILSKLKCKVQVVPYHTKYEDISILKPNGIILSNGPGDPDPCEEAIEVAKSAVRDKVPLLGICLGHQILALACGAKSKKMLFGHHGSNHPIQNLKTGKIYITSQNHGFVVDEKSLGPYLEVTHKSLFDGTIQGLSHKSSPAFSFQGHPEGSPGPQDLEEIFSHFFTFLRSKH
jgi:carbamoyl-phosphate synthase small subunit